MVVCFAKGNFIVKNLLIDKIIVKSARAVVRLEIKAEKQLDTADGRRKERNKEEKKREMRERRRKMRKRKKKRETEGEEEGRERG